MKRIIIGTAGHVDHGKTSLIQAMTGVNCDRLKEEKQRGLTIELGFTSLDLPSGEKVGVVDVPGHVKFIRHMLSGASGIDLVLLVIAADEGVMPQTIEHIQICSLLGIERGIIVLTKIDMVDDDLLELAGSDIEDFVSKTFLRDAPVVHVSSATGEGIEKLKTVIDEQIRTLKERRITGIPILPVDRVFTIKGFGTVVTGTMKQGFFEEDQEVEVEPGGQKARVRNIQVHGQEVDKALAGMRTAINLQGLATEDITRGQWVVPAGIFTPTRLIDARLDLLDDPPKSELKVHIGTVEVMAEMNVRSVDGTDVARIRLKHPVIASFHDRFIVRNISPSKTIGGGEVINPAPARRFSEEITLDLISPERTRQVLGIVKDAGLRGISKKDLTAVFAESASSMDKVIAELLSSGQIIRFDPVGDLYVYGEYLKSLKELVVEKTKEHHVMHPSSPGISREHLRSSLKGNLEPKLFHKALTDLIKKGEIEEIGPDIRIQGFQPSLGDALGDIGEKVYKKISGSGFEPPRVPELIESLRISARQMEEVLGFLARQGRLVKIKDDIYLTRERESELREKVRRFIGEHQSMAPGDMKEIIDVSRKFAIPYLEYLDRIHFTVRVENVRKLGSGR
ncbi:MAG TPA: selenocysteine-specific translation elongation factor [Deltaproteobacteria bacterium]|nr:selenocysteine-specific translation elongation factor [Deltaproteobacteria bacterium]